MTSHTHSKSQTHLGFHASFGPLVFLRGCLGKNYEWISRPLPLHPLEQSAFLFYILILALDFSLKEVNSRAYFS